MATMRDLTERAVNFDYGYNMKCGDCGCITSMTSEIYYREENSARINCANCPAVIHHGPNVTALRDERDPVLDDAAAVNAAWYHTTVHPGWPSCGGPRWPADLKVPGSSPDAAAHVLDRHENQALHLGTYEAAMLSTPALPASQPDSRRSWRAGPWLAMFPGWVRRGDDGPACRGLCARRRRPCRG